MDLEHHKISISRDVSFHETIIPFAYSPSPKGKPVFQPPSFHFEEDSAPRATREVSRLHSLHDDSPNTASLSQPR